MKIFIIMPFSETTEKHTKHYWDYFYKRIKEVLYKNEVYIKKIFKKRKLEIYRASAPQGNIVGSILKNLEESDIVIAVLTDKNPNVFYELGIRHALSNKTIMLCQNSQKIPFDLSVYGVALYEENKIRFRVIEKEILERFNQIVQYPDTPDNPVSDCLRKDHKQFNQKKTKIKVAAADYLEETNRRYTPVFYRGRTRMGSGRTFFGLIIEVSNFLTENIAIIKTKLDLQIYKKKLSVDEFLQGKYIQTYSAKIIIKPKYKRKFTLNPREIYQDLAVFVLDKSVPDDLSEITGKIVIIDMHNNKHYSPKIKFIPYS